MLREQPSCRAIARTPSPLRAITRISTACSWVNIVDGQKAAILTQVGQIYFGAVGQFSIGGDTCPFRGKHSRSLRSSSRSLVIGPTCFRVRAGRAGR